MDRVEVDPTQPKLWKDAEMEVDQNAHCTHIPKGREVGPFGLRALATILPLFLRRHRITGGVGSLRVMSR